MSLFEGYERRVDASRCFKKAGRSTARHILFHFFNYRISYIHTTLRDSIFNQHSS